MGDDKTSGHITLCGPVGTVLQNSLGPNRPGWWSADMIIEPPSFTDPPCRRQVTEHACSLRHSSVPLLLTFMSGVLRGGRRQFPKKSNFTLISNRPILFTGAMGP
jgi:hypothetical protein